MSEVRWKWILYGSPIGAVVGYLLGLWAPDLMLTTGFLGGLFQNALRVIAAPLIITSIVVAVGTLASSRKIGRPAVVALFYFVATTVVAVVVALIMGLAFQPGFGIDVAGATPPSFLNMFRTMTVDQFVVSIIPSSVPGAVVQGNYLGLVILSVVFGLILSRAGRSAKRVSDLFNEIFQLLMRVIEWLMVVVPVGVLFVVSRAVAESQFSGAEMLGQLGTFTWVVIAALAIHAVVLLPLALKMLSRQSVLGTAGQMMPAFAAAFATQSTTSALPVTIDCAVNRCHLDRRASDFVLPLGAVFNVGATALYAVIGTLFVAQAFAITLSIPQVMLIGLIAVALSFGVASIPYSTMFIMFVLFGISGFPSQAYAGIGLIMVVDWLLDRVRSAVNVWSDVVGTAIVAESLDTRASSRKTSGRTTTRRASTSRDSSRQTRRPATASHSRNDRQQRGRRNERSTSATDNGRRQRTGSGSRGERSPFDITRGESQLVDLETPAALDKHSSDSRSPRRGRSGGTGRGRAEGPVTRREPSRSNSRRNGRTSDESRKATEAETASESSSRSAIKLPPPPPLPVFEKPKPAVAEPKSEEPKVEAPSEKVEERKWEEDVEDLKVTPSVADDEISDQDQDQETPEERSDTGEEEPEQAREDSESEEEEEAAEPQFGRKRSRRRELKKEEAEETEETEDEKPQTEEIAYSTEGQSFGRARKKRTR